MKRLRFTPALLLLALWSGGCAHVCARWCAAHQAEVAAQLPPAEPHEPPDPEPELPLEPEPPAEPEPEVEALSPLAEADTLFARNELALARSAYRAYLEVYPQGEETDRALLRLAVIYLLPSGPAYDPDRARRVLDRLLADYPESAERPAALALRRLDNQAMELQRQLDELKRIDLERGSARNSE